MVVCRDKGAISKCDGNPVGVNFGKRLGEWLPLALDGHYLAGVEQIKFSLNLRSGLPPKLPVHRMFLSIFHRFLLPILVD